MKISPSAKEVLPHILFNQRAAVSEIARVTKLREHTVRSAIRWLLENDVIRPETVISNFRRGLNDHAIFLSLASRDSSAFSGFIKRVVTAPQVFFCADVSGEYDCVFSIVAKNLSELDRVLRELSGAHTVPITARVMASRVSWTHFVPGYLNKSGCLRSELTNASDGNVVELDEFDEKLLGLLGRPIAFSLQALARELGVPPTSVQYRLKNLERKQVVMGYRYHLNPTALGRRAYTLLIYERSLGTDLGRKLLAFCRKSRFVYSIVSSFGPWSFEINGHFLDADEVLNFTQELYDNFGDSILTVKALSELRVLKPK